MDSLDPAAITYYSPLRERLRSEVLAAEHRLERLSHEMVASWSPGIMARLQEQSIVPQHAYRPAVKAAFDQYTQKLTALPMPPDTESALRVLRSTVHIYLAETALSLSSTVAWLESFTRTIIASETGNS